MRAVDFRRRESTLMLLCDIAWLSRLSITIFSCDWLAYASKPPRESRKQPR